MALALESIKQLREETSLSVIECKKALEESGGDMAKAREILLAQGARIAEKKSDRSTAEGIVYSYIHNTGKVGVLLELSCETDFVARTDDFKQLAHNLSLQIASLSPQDVEGLLAQDFIKDGSLTIEKLVQQTIQKTGENIQVRRFVRYCVGE